MYRNNFCSLDENIKRQDVATNSHLLSYAMYEDNKCRTATARESLTSSEKPVVREQDVVNQICRQMKILEQEKCREERRQILLHREEEEIRKFKALIKRAHIQKYLAEQKAFKENKMKKELEARLEENKRLAEEFQRSNEIALEEERASVRKKAAFRQDLLKQMHERDKQRKLEEEAIKQEREKSKKVVEKIQQDIENEKQYEQAHKQMLMRDRDKYLQEVELYEKQREILHQDDDRKDAEFVRHRNEVERLCVEKRKKSMQERAALSKRIGLQVLGLETEKQKRDDLLQELLIDERLAKDENRFQMNLKKQLNRTKALREDFHRYTFLRDQDVVIMREEERREAKEQLKFVQELERKENEIRNIKIPKNKQYRQDLLNAIQHKKWEREFETRQKRILHDQQLEFKNKRRQEIDAEKLRLLKQQPADIFKFLPHEALSAEHGLLLGINFKEAEGKNSINN